MITEGRLTPSNFHQEKHKVLAAVRRAAVAGIPLVQIREKSISAADLCELSTAAVAATADTVSLITVNDRADVAVAAGAAGVHLTDRSLPVSDVRRSLGREFLIGVSTHETGEVRRAVSDGADFAVFGPVFPTPGKGEPVGIDELRRVAAAVSPFPVLGLGGIDHRSFREVCSVTAGFAAIRLLNDPAGVESVAEFIRNEKQIRVR